MDENGIYGIETLLVHWPYIRTGPVIILVLCLFRHQQLSSNADTLEEDDLNNCGTPTLQILRWCDDSSSRRLLCHPATAAMTVGLVIACCISVMRLCG